MSWFDDLEMRVKQSGDAALKDINTYLAGRVVDETVKVAAAQSGNLTAAELAAGKRGGQDGVPNANQQNPNAMSAGQVKQAAQMLSPFLLVGIAVAAWFLIGSKRRG